MGIFNVTIEAGDAASGRFESIAALVDTGATYTMLPADMLRRFGVRAMRKQRLLLANGEEVIKEVWQIDVRVEGREGRTFVVFSDNGATSVLGAVTLEELGFGVDPVARRLIDVPGYLM